MMVRYTIRLKTGEARCCQLDGNAVVERLAQYEDSGLLPEEVERVKLALMGKGIYEIKEFDGLPIKRLRELAEADKNECILVLPCKVGTPVYRIHYPIATNHAVSFSMAIAIARNYGWSVGKRGWFCPECRKKRRMRGNG